MKNLQHKIPWLLMLLALLALVSCRKDKDILTTIGGTIEDAPVEDDGKVFLSDREQWLRWEKDDQIYIWSTEGVAATYDLEEASYNKLTGTFSSTNSEVTANSTIYAFYPPTLATKGSGTITSGSMTLFWPSRHDYRTTNPSDTLADNSFGKGAIPMVAYRDAHDPNDLFFHSLAGILRFQLYAGGNLTDEATDEFTIQTITFEARDEDLSGDLSKQLSGPFTISKTSIEDPQPQIVPTVSPSANNRKDTISNINKIIGGTGANKNNLFTFYLPLPAVADPYGGGTHKTTYHLKMKVIGTQNDGTKETVTKYFSRTLTVDIRRLSVTMMPAMEITGLSTDETGSGSTGTPTIVGCGTPARPFQVYTADQLKYLRDCNNNHTTVNGQTLGSNTYIKICRSDITLTAPSSKQVVVRGRPRLRLSATKDDPVGTSTEWNQGFVDFAGHFYFSSSAGENGGITNNSGHPLFESIVDNAWVEGVYVKGTINLNSGSGNFSPLCGENAGTMKDCHNKCRVTSTSGHNLAGLCCTNTGTITGGANDGQLTTTGNVAGICYSNSGTLQGNFSLSSAVPDGTNIAGICYSNSGYVQDCQVSANVGDITSSGNWGVVVFENSGEVTNCRSAGTIVFSTSGSIGGVVNTNNAGGIVDGCSLNVTLRGGAGSVGGIVAVVNGGVVRNCYANGEPTISGTPMGGSLNQALYAGGIVGWLHGGAVYNCYNRCMVSGATNSGSMLGRIDNGAIIENCWSDQPSHFLGEVSDRGDQGEIGPFCFSAYASDTNRNTNLNCALILPYWYRIMVPWSMKHRVDQAVASSSELSPTNARFKTLTDNYYVSGYYGTEAHPPVLEPVSRPAGDKYLSDALNTWVDTYGEAMELNKYRRWYSPTDPSSSDIYPVYYDPDVHGTTKHYRKQRYPHRR